MNILICCRTAAADLADARVKILRRIQSARWLMMRIMQSLLMLVAIVILSLFAEVIMAI